MDKWTPVERIVIVVQYPEYDFPTYTGIWHKTRESAEEYLEVCKRAVAHMVETNPEVVEEAGLPTCSIQTKVICEGWGICYEDHRKKILKHQDIYK